jgi:hypothetical protein
MIAKQKRREKLNDIHISVDKLGIGLLPASRPTWLHRGKSSPGVTIHTV